MTKAYFRYPDGEVVSTNDPEIFPGGSAVRLPAKEGEAALRDYACSKLLEILKPGDTIYVILRHVSASGMTRDLSLIVARVDDDGRPYIRDITSYAIDACGFGDSRDGYARIGGCGMDMGFHAVYTLGRVLWPNGTPEPHGTRNGKPDSSGGYALKHQWL